MKKLFQILALGAALALCGCEVKTQVSSQPATPKSIDGQIFISLYSGESFKLGSVEVAVCNPSDVASNLSVYISDTKTVMKELTEFKNKTMTKAEIYIARRDEAGLESLKLEIMEFVIKKGVEHSKRAEKLFTSTPVIARGSTDADGKFSIPVDSGGTYVIMARDVFAAGGRPQQIHWIVKTTTGTKNFMLNSLNITKIFEPDEDDFISKLETLRDDLTK